VYFIASRFSQTQYPCIHTITHKAYSRPTNVCRYDNRPVCADCVTCPVGQYNTGSVCILPPLQQGSDPATSTTTPPCSPCPACPSGKYLAKACSGSSMGKPDHICQPCASCGMDTYIAACRNVGGLNSTSQTSADWLPPPPDAGKCTPCQTCAAGSYISQRCDGSKFTDNRQCSPCEGICAQGTYMHAKCSGNTFNASSNDCRQVSPT
jgi:hypothetical protein